MDIGKLSIVIAGNAAPWEETASQTQKGLSTFVNTANVKMQALKPADFAQARASLNNYVDVAMKAFDKLKSLPAPTVPAVVANPQQVQVPNIKVPETPAVSPLQVPVQVPNIKVPETPTVSNPLQVPVEVPSIAGRFQSAIDKTKALKASITNALDRATDVPVIRQLKSGIQSVNTAFDKFLKERYGALAKPIKMAGVATDLSLMAMGKIVPGASLMGQVGGMAAAEGLLQAKRLSAKLDLDWGGAREEIARVLSPVRTIAVKVAAPVIAPAQAAIHALTAGVRSIAVKITGPNTTKPALDIKQFAEQSQAWLKELQAVIKKPNMLTSAAEVKAFVVKAQANLDVLKAQVKRPELAPIRGQVQAFVKQAQANLDSVKMHGDKLAPPSGLAQSRAAIAAFATFAIAQLSSFTNKMMESLAQTAAMARQADSLGLSVENFQGLMRIGRVDAEDLTHAMQRLERTFGDARDGSSQAGDALQRLGVDATQAVAPNELIQRVMDGFSRVQDPIERTRLSMALFGRTGGALGAQFARGSGALRDFVEKGVQSGEVLTASQVRAAQEATAAWREFQHAGVALWRELATMPAELSRNINNATGSEIDLTRLPAGVLRAWGEWIHEIPHAFETTAERARRLREEMSQLRADQQAQRVGNALGNVQSFIDKTAEATKGLDKGFTHLGGGAEMGQLVAMTRQLNALDDQRRGLNLTAEQQRQYTEAIRSGQQAINDFTGAVVDRWVAEMVRAQRTVGMTAEQVRLWELQMHRVDPALIRRFGQQMERLSFVRLTQEAKDAMKELQKTIATLGMSSEEVKRFELESKKRKLLMNTQHLPQEEIDQKVAALDREIARYDRLLAQKERLDQMNKDLDAAKEINTELQSPLDKLYDDLAKVERLAKEGFISWDQYYQHAARAFQGIAQDAARVEMPKIEFAGSKEAIQTINRTTTLMQNQKPEDLMARIAREQLEQQKAQVRVGRDVVDAIRNRPVLTEI